ncbi:hypothetical protein HS125_05280 [bacterium]|nr:hypothetical protein [bacterium]
MTPAKTLWYVYTPQTDGNVQITAAGYDTVISVWLDACCGNFANLVACVDAFGHNKAETVGFKVLAGHHYLIEVAEYGTSLGQSLTFSLSGPAATVAAVCAPSPTPTSTPTPDPNATPSVTPAATPPPNDLCVNAKVVNSRNFVDVLTTGAATSSPDDPVQPCSFGGGVANSRTVWYMYTPSAAGRVNLSAAGYDTVISVWKDACCGDFAGLVACVDAFGRNKTETAGFDAEVGHSYLIEVSEYGDSPGQMLIFTLSGPEPLPVSPCVPGPGAVSEARKASRLDLNRNGAIDAGDLALLSSMMSEGQECDLNDDGRTDYMDILVFSRYWGSNVGVPVKAR